MNKENFEYCTLCDKLYLLLNHKTHINTKKHKKQLFLKELCEENIIYDVYSLDELIEKPNEDVFNIPIDSE